MGKDKRVWLVIVLALIIFSSGYELSAWSWSLHIGEEVCAGSIVTSSSGSRLTVEYGFVVSNNEFQMEQFREGNAGYTIPIPINSIRSLDYDSCVVVCTPNWECGAWGDCVESRETRICSDLNGCEANKVEWRDCQDVPPQCSIASDCGTAPPCEDICWYECESGDCVLKHFDVSLLLFPLIGLGAAVTIYLKWIKK